MQECSLEEYIEVLGTIHHGKTVFQPKQTSMYGVHDPPARVKLLGAPAGGLRKETKVNIEMAPHSSPSQIISRPRPLAITSFPPDLPVIPSMRTMERAHVEQARTFAGPSHTLKYSRP